MNTPSIRNENKGLGRLPASDDAVTASPGPSDPSPQAVSAIRRVPQGAARGIHVGLSWPRAATPCALTPRWEGEFRDFTDWVNFASKRLTVARHRSGATMPSVCIDAFGRRCVIGGDFMRARDEGAFPVRYFWDCWEGDQ